MLRQDFEAEVDDGILAGRIVIDQMNLGLGRGTQLVVGDRLSTPSWIDAVQRFLKQAVLVHLLDEVGRNLAGTEAGHPHLRGDFLHLGIDARFDIWRRNGQA
jgi:hypothetical protein